MLPHSLVDSHNISQLKYLYIVSFRSLGEQICSVIIKLVT